MDGMYYYRKIIKENIMSTIMNADIGNMKISDLLDKLHEDQRDIMLSRIYDLCINLRKYKESEMFFEHPYVNKEDALRYQTVLRGISIYDNMYSLACHIYFGKNKDDNLREKRFNDYMKEMNSIIRFLKLNINELKVSSIEEFLHNTVNIGQILKDEWEEECYSKIKNQIEEHEKFMVQQMINEEERKAEEFKETLKQ